LETASEFYEAFPLALALASGVFAKGGWSEVPLANMALRETTALLERLKGMPEEDLRLELDGVVLAYFRRNNHAELRAMVEGWEEHFPERRETFAQALFAHEEGLYRLTIPTLAVEVEGILRDLTEEYGRNRNWLDRFNEAFCFGHGPNDLPEVPDLERLAADLMAMPAWERYEEVEELRARFVLVRINELFGSGDLDDPDFVSSVRRHAIGHGAFKAHGELESLRLFFLLELLHDAVGRYMDRVWLVGATRKHRALLKEWASEDPGAAELLAWPPANAGARKEGGYGSAQRWVVHRGGEAAGFASIEADGPGGLGRIAFFVAPSFRGRGIGAKVVRLLVKEARRRNLPGLTAVVARVVPEDGPAARCLLRAGFFPPEINEQAYLLRFGARVGARGTGPSR